MLHPAPSLSQPRSAEIRISCHPRALSILPRHRSTWACTSSMSQLSGAGRCPGRYGEDVYPRALGMSLPLFPKVTLIPPNLLGLPSLDHLVQHQVPQTGMVIKTYAQIPSLLPTNCVTSETHLSEPSNLSWKMGHANSICFAGLQ